MITQLGRVFAYVTLLLAVITGHAHADQYRLQLVHIEENLFFRYVESRGAPFRAERHVLPRLEEILDQAEFPVQALLLDRDIQSIPALGPPPPAEPIVPRIVLPRKQNPWTVVDWQGTAGEIAVFAISSHRVHYQELIAVAVNANGVLRRLPVHGIPIFGNRKMHAPSVSTTYLEYVLKRGTFKPWVARHAESLHGLSVIIGRNDDVNYPDTVYVVVQMPPQDHTYKIVMAWKDRDDLRKDNDENGRNR